MRESGVGGILVYCADFKGGHAWPDDLGLSDIEARCSACGHRGADVRPDFKTNCQARLCTLLYLRRGTDSVLLRLCNKTHECCAVSENRVHARLAAAALPKMAKATSDPKVAAGLIEAAANLKEQRASPTNQHQTARCTD